MNPNQTRPDMRRLFSASLIALLFAAVAVPSSSAQDAEDDVMPAPEARPSPMRLAATTIDGTYIKVVYGSPRMRGRDIFGGLVPLGQVWRTGANEATEILFTEDVMIAGQHVDAGIYSMFTIPNEDSWTIILNGVLGQWGAFTHDADQDIHRIDVPASESDTVYEAFTMTFDEIEEGETPTSTTLHLNWESTHVAIPIETM